MCCIEPDHLVWNGDIYTCYDPRISSTCFLLFLTHITVLPYILFCTVLLTLLILPHFYCYILVPHGTSEPDDGPPFLVVIIRIIFTWNYWTGFGNSGRHELGAELRRTWLQSFHIVLDLPPSIVVSPSFSGVYSLPMLVLHPHEFDGFVPIAVDATDEIPVLYLQNLMVSCLLRLLWFTYKT